MHTASKIKHSAVQVQAIRHMVATEAATEAATNADATTPHPHIWIMLHYSLLHCA
jgi:hypothetical protein